MTDVLDTLYSWLSFLPRITKLNILETAAIAFPVYEILTWIKTTRAWTLSKGIMIISASALFAYIFNLSTIQWILEKTVLVAATALVIIFQPEFRETPEQLGSKNLLTDILSFDDGKASLGFTEETVNELARATFEMAKVKTGALIVIERGVSLKEVERAGVKIGDVVSSQLLISILEYNTPLHDGAVIIRGNRTVAATYYLSLSDGTTIGKDLGTRYRAAMDISKSTDSVTIVVSEETSRISVAENGVLTKVDNVDTLRRRLLRLEKDGRNGSRSKIWEGRQKDERKADEQSGT